MSTPGSLARARRRARLPRLFLFLLSILSTPTASASILDDARDLVSTFLDKGIRIGVDGAKILINPFDYIAHLVATWFAEALRAIGDGFSTAFALVAGLAIGAYTSLGSVFTNVSDTLYLAAYRATSAIGIAAQNLNERVGDAMGSAGPFAPIVTIFAFGILAVGAGYAIFVSVRLARNLIKLGVRLL